MMRNSRGEHCHDCHDYSRRDFLRASAAGLAAGAALSAFPALAKETGTGEKSETLVASLYKTLSDEQKGKVCFAFDDELRTQVDNNWHITPLRLAQDFSPEQQDLVKQIFMNLHSEEYRQTVFDQVEHDNGGSGGFGKSAIAMFGEPGSGKFEFVLTSRHVTRRCDGNSVEGAAFGGPIFYGHAAEAFNEPADHPGNAYWYQAKRANELFQALSGKQQELALRSDPREERQRETVVLSGKTSGLHGVPMSELSKDQQELAKQVMADVLAPFREADVQESMKLIEKNGTENLHFAFYKNENLDIGNDRVWDVWQIEGPAMVWYFRGAPHVHTYVHIRESA